MATVLESPFCIVISSLQVSSDVTRFSDDLSYPLTWTCRPTGKNSPVHILHLAIKTALFRGHFLPSHLDNVQIWAKRSSWYLMYFVSKFQPKAYGLMQISWDVNTAVITLLDIMSRISGIVRSSLHNIQGQNLADMITQKMKFSLTHELFLAMKMRLSQNESHHESKPQVHSSHFGVNPCRRCRFMFST